MSPKPSANLGPEDFRTALEMAFRAGGQAFPVILGLESVAGGSINQTFHIRTADGHFFCKWNPKSPADMFKREQEGLEALAESGTSLHIPRIVGISSGPADAPALLLMEYLEPQPQGPTRQTWEKLGRGLAELHRCGQDRFGFAKDNYCGLTLQENPWTTNWTLFYGRHRLGALVNRLQHRGNLSPGMHADFEALLKKLPQLLAHGPNPSLIHGDLWSGNFLASSSGPALVDPAVYFADREAEWAMLLLFGGFPDTVLDAYQESWPLPQGWRERIPLYQLYHVLNHFALFGGSYGEQAMRIVRKYL